MKKVLLIASAIAMLGAVSCKKEWTCKCDFFGETISTTTEKMTKSDAKKICEEPSMGLCKIE